MRISDEDTLRSLNKYRATVLGLPAMSFEDWQHAREDKGDHRDKAKDYLKAPLPGSPVPDCSHA